MTNHPRVSDASPIAATSPRCSSWTRSPIRAARSALLLFAAASLAFVPASAAPPLRSEPGATRLARVESAPAAPADTHSHAPITAVESVTITVSDLDAALAFYTGVLTCRQIEVVEDAGDRVERLTGVFGTRTRTATLALGDERLKLVQFVAPEGRPVPPDSRSNDRWFQHIAIVVSDIDQAYAHLRSHKVRHASSGPQTLPETIPPASGISAFYFKDPDGHALEIIHFPPGKGEARWQSKSSLFLGIDHTAIVVADTDDSLRFYRDLLGLRVVGESENFGSEQEHLNNVFGARLRITALRATSGPGVELLEYLAPRDGRPAPADARLNDLWTFRTNLKASQLASLERQLIAANVSLVSAAAVHFDDHTSLAIRDPDGHAVIISQDAPQSAPTPSGNTKP
ncbi:MAG: VOC family protein [Planctomycetota bacterium]|nr:VOC family protein [Planctomycetota bacterium]